MEKILEGKLMILFVLLVLGVIYLDTLQVNRLDTDNEVNEVTTIVMNQSL